MEPPNATVTTRRPLRALALAHDDRATVEVDVLHAQREAFHQAHEREVFYYVTPNRIRKLTGETTRSGRPATRSDDVVDIGVLRLTGDLQPPYPEVSKFAMEPDYLRPRYLPRAGRSYAVLGFPAAKSKVSRVERTALVAPYAFRCEPVRDEDYAKHGFAPKEHLLLKLNLKVGFGPNGDRTSFPKPQGMSGSPIMIMYSDGPADDARVFPVVAVGGEYRSRERLLVGTDVSYVIEAIEGPLKGSLPYPSAVVRTCSSRVSE